MSASDSSQNGSNGFSETPLATPSSTSPPSDIGPPKINKEQLRYVVLDCMDARKSRAEIRQKVMAYGYTEVEADRFIERIEMEQRRTLEYDNEVRGDARFLVGFGGGACLVGIGLIVACVIAASFDLDLIANPLWLGVLVVGAAANFIGARLFWRGLSMK
jgi:hypothetical protein